MLIRSFINKEQIASVEKFVNTLQGNKKHCVGKDAFYYPLETCLNIPNAINEIRKKCLNHIGKKCYQDHVLKDVVFVIKPNGNIEKHTDPIRQNCKHIRYVVMIKKSKNGGILFDGEKEIKMNVGDLYILDTSNEHYVTTVEDNSMLFGLSFGFQVPI